ncbi:MAG: Vi polysaccharide biosynthesis UDP-N-acetylglucosamine C-6 dehydrogenase TviB, partial [bacterium]|nr:Vi polysaccharide biosynthesis UDP-N-acetylglucosamine C-6 dehydrogenase TviB [bacterium]
VDSDQAEREYGFRLIDAPNKEAYDVVVIAVAHDEFRALGDDGLRSFGKKTSVLYDIKYVLPPELVDDRL